MKPFYLNALCIFLCFTKPTLSQEINAGARITSLGNIGVAVTDVWNLQSNPAGIVDLKRVTASVDCRNDFLNKEITNQSAVIVVPISGNFVGLSFQRSGFSALTEQKIGINYAKPFGESLALAVGFNYHQLSISQYGSASSYSTEVGFQYRPARNIIIGGHVANPFQSGYSDDAAASIPVRFEIGASYLLSDKLLLNSGIVKTLDFSTSLRAGLEYSLDSFAIRAGIASAPFKQYAGFGYKINQIRIDLAVSAQAVLGYSPQLAIEYAF